MKLYLAGMEPSYLANLDPAPVLVSFAARSQLRCVGQVEDLLVDSGAFTAWKQGKKIDLDAYCAFLKENGSNLTAAFALDVIGGTERENLANLDRMEASGLTLPILPVYHIQDNGPGLLMEYLERGYRYIALGGTVGQKPDTICRWLDWVFSLDLPADVRFHGCGITSQQVLTEFLSLLFSVDSTTWLAFAQYGIQPNLNLLAGRSQGFLQRFGAAALQDALTAPPKPRKPSKQMNFLEALA